MWAFFVLVLQGTVMNEIPFSLIKRANRPFYLVSFKDKSGKYLPPLSTKKQDEREARQVAFQWLRDGIPQRRAEAKSQSVSVGQLALKELIRKLETKTEVDTVLKELRRRGWLKSYVLAETPAARDFVDFLVGFWDWDNSDYIKEKRRKNHSIHKSHCKQQGHSVKLYWEPFFRGRFLGEITAADIDAFVNHMGDKPISPSRKNVIIQAGTKPLRWALSKGMIETDPTKGIMLFSGEAPERNILTPTAAEALFKTQWKENRVKLANLLAAVTGMRQGEILALRVQDLGKDCLYVRHSWRKLDGLKTTKNGEGRIVEMPFSSLMSELINTARENPHGAHPESFVFWSENKADIPMCGDRFRDGLREALQDIGYSVESAKSYRFHDWRHYYTAYMMDKVNEKLLQKQTGHKTLVMLKHYGGHLISGDRERIREAQLEVFGGLLP